MNPININPVQKNGVAPVVQFNYGTVIQGDVQGDLVCGNQTKGTVFKLAEEYSMFRNLMDRTVEQIRQSQLTSPTVEEITASVQESLGHLFEKLDDKDVQKCRCCETSKGSETATTKNNQSKTNNEEEPPKDDEKPLMEEHRKDDEKNPKEEVPPKDDEKPVSTSNDVAPPQEVNEATNVVKPADSSGSELVEASVVDAVVATPQRQRTHDAQQRARSSRRIRHLQAENEGGLPGRRRHRGRN